MSKRVMIIMMGVFMLWGCESLLIGFYKKQVVTEVFVDSDRFFVQVKTEEDEKYSDVLAFNEIEIISRDAMDREESVTLKKDVLGWEKLYVKMWPVEGSVQVEDKGRWKRVEKVDEGDVRAFGLDELWENGALEIISTDKKVWVVVHMGVILD